jgi:hypothetical protein
MEPLVVPPEEMSKFVYPVRLPYNKKGALHLKRQMEENIQDLKEKASKAKDDIVLSLTSSMNKLPDWLRNRIGSPPNDYIPRVEGSTAQELASPPPVSENIYPLTHQRNCAGFNRYGRLDFCLEESLFENSYVSAIRSHLSYWDDIDVASFLACELLSLPKRPTHSTSP